MRKGNERSGGPACPHSPCCLLHLTFMQTGSGHRDIPISQWGGMEVQDAGLPRSGNRREPSWTATHWSLRPMPLGWEATFGADSILRLLLPVPWKVICEHQHRLPFCSVCDLRSASVCAGAHSASMDVEAREGLQASSLSLSALCFWYRVSH